MAKKACITGEIDWNKQLCNSKKWHQKCTQWRSCVVELRTPGVPGIQNVLHRDFDPKEHLRECLEYGFVYKSWGKKTSFDFLKLLITSFSTIFPFQWLVIYLGGTLFRAHDQVQMGSNSLAVVLLQAEWWRGEESQLFTHEFSDWSPSIFIYYHLFKVELRWIQLHSDNSFYRLTYRLNIPGDIGSIPFKTSEPN